MTLRIFLRTLPCILMRVVVFSLFGLAVILFLAIVVGGGLAVQALFPSANVTALYAVTMVVAVTGSLALARLAERYVLYPVKIGHVAVVTELVTKGSLPPNTNQFHYGKAKVANHFGSASVLFATDQLVSAAVRQTMRWLTRLPRRLRRIPGDGLAVALLRSILSIGAHHIGEAVMSYVLIHSEDIWQAAADGVVLYAQRWKRLLLAATILAFSMSLIWLAGSALLTMGFGALVTSIADGSLSMTQAAPYVIGAIPALFLASILRWLVVDPLATVAMIVSYHRAVQGQAPSYDLRAQLASVSAQFRVIAERATPGLRLIRQEAEL